MSTACRRNTTTSSVCTPTTFFVSGCTPLLLVGRGGVSSPAHARHEGRVVEDAFRIEVRSTNRGYRRLMPGVVSALGQRVLPACAILFRVRSSHAVVWPGHKSYPLGVLDGTDGFRVTAEGSTGRLGYSVAGAGVSGTQIRVYSALHLSYVCSRMFFPGFPRSSFSRAHIPRPRMGNAAIQRPIPTRLALPANVRLMRKSRALRWRSKNPQSW